MIFSLRPSSLVTAFVLACTSIFTSALAEEHPPQFAFTDLQMKSLGVELITIGKKLAAGTSSFPGQIVLPPQQEHSVTAATTSVIEQVLVSEGQSVHANSPLLVLNSPDLGQLQLAVLTAANHDQLAKDALARDNELFADGFIARRRLQETQATAQESAAGFNQARSVLALAGMSQAGIDQIIVTGKVSNQITLTAPTDGVVVDANIKPGMRVAEATILLRIVRMDTLWVDIQIPSQLTANWKPGTRFHLTNGLEAKVLNVSPLTNGTQTRLLRGVISKGTANMHPGEFVQAELPVAADNTWDIPLAALVREEDKTYVFIRRKDAFTATPIEVLNSAGQRAQVRGEFAAGDRIASTSVIALKAAWLGMGGMEEE